MKSRSTFLHPELSVVMPVRNAEPFLREAVQSILGQPLSVPFELVVVDDASTDASFDLLNSFASPCLTVARLPEQAGAAGARNAALRRVRSPWICLFDADDVMQPDFLEPYFQWVKAQPGAGWAYCALELVDRHLAPLGQQHRNPFDLFKMVQRNILPQAMTIVQTDLVWQAGAYDATLRTCEDYDLWLRLLEWSRPVFFNQIGMRYRQHDTNLGRVTSSNQAVHERLEARLRTQAENPQQEQGREILRRVRHFIDASERRDFQTVRQLGAWLFQQGVEGFERDRRLAEAFLAGGDAATAMSLSMSWVQRAAQGQFLLPYELAWTLTFSMRLALRERQTSQVAALLPLLDAAAASRDPELEACRRLARQYLQKDPDRCGGPAV